MQLTLDKQHENKVTFIAEGASVAFSNILRRYCMTHVPVIAIDKAVFYENSSALFDEYMAHRLGLIPIVTPAKVSPDVEVSFRLDESGPKKVYSKDMKSSDKEIVPARDEIPIMTLGADQHIRFEATAKLGYGTSHAKFQAGLVSYDIQDGKVVFMVESFHQMSPRDVIVRGCHVLLEDLKEMKKQLEKGDEKPKKKKK